MRVSIFGALRAVAGAKEVEVGAAGTVADVLEKLSVGYPALAERLLDERGSLRGSILVLVNGRSIRFLHGVKTAIEESDRVALFPPIGGG